MPICQTFPQVLLISLSPAVKNVASARFDQLTAPSCACLPGAGHHDSSPDRGRGLRGVHLQGFGEQRSGRVPHHHGGVGAAAAEAAAETQQFPKRPEAGLTAPVASTAGSD